MPSPTPTRCRAVRQLSLQNPVNVQSAGYKLKKQLSEDDSRILDPVEITGRGWLTPEKPDSGLRVNYSEDKSGQVKAYRPKAVKVAWAEKKKESLEDPTGVEVVATKCQRQSKPLSIKAQRFRNPLLGNKDTLVYTRLQLAERLRNVWNEREKTKPNLNIFLAHTTDTTRSENSATDRQEIPFLKLDSADKKRKSMQMRALSQDYCPPNVFQSKLEISSFGLKLQNGYFKHEKQESQVEKKDSQVNAPEKVPREENNCLQEHNKIEIRVTKLSQEEIVNDTDKEKENLEDSVSSGDTSGDKDMKLKNSQSAVITAKERRNNFRINAKLQRTINESFTCSFGNEGEKLNDPNSNEKKPCQKKMLVRALSAPTGDQSCQKPNPKTVKFLLQKSGANGDPSNPTAESVAAMRERIKSAPIRRKLKSAAARRKNKDKMDSSSEDERESCEVTKKTSRRISGKNGNDVVTMVSLVSPAGSDTEDSVFSLPVEPLLGEEEKREAAGQAKTCSEQNGSSLLIQNFVSLRKATKTVSFQGNVAIRNYSTSFPSRRAPAGTPIIIPSPVISNPALTPAQIQERDKRQPAFPGVDGRGIKRRLLRSPSEPPKEEDSYNESGKQNADTYNGISNITKKSLNMKYNTESSSEEPDFKCPKERECWNLYKKMLAKGVSVSFDTVLRGMLTPTEYRLRKNRSSCIEFFEE